MASQYRSLLRVALATSLCASCGSDPENPLEGLTTVGEDPTDSPIRGIDADAEERFAAGDAIFELPFRPTQGLGPLYIRQSCGSCHADDAKGPGTVHKMVELGPDGEPTADQSALEYGHTVRNQLAGAAMTGIEPPTGVNVLLSTRLGPAVFGRGYLEAIADAEVERIEAEQATRTDGISGRIHRVRYQSEANPSQPFHMHAPGDDGIIGRFGLKARIATIDEFTADAFQGDMGITSPLRPVELPNPDRLDDDLRPGLDVDAMTINVVADYVRLLDIPRRPATLDTGGARLFEQALCATCHVPTMRTRADYPIAQLAGVEAAVFTDLLIHDMGDELADGLSDGDAGPREWRTAPLIGIRHLRSYLHDGRAATVEDAIRMHEGRESEANGSVEAFDAMSPEDRAALVAFVELP